MNEDIGNSNEKVRRVVAQFLELSEIERQQALDLMYYATGESPASVAAAWATEIERRVRGMDDGTHKAIPWSEARKKLGFE